MMRFAGYDHVYINLEAFLLYHILAISFDLFLKIYLQLHVYRFVYTQH